MYAVTLRDLSGDDTLNLEFSADELADKALVDKNLKRSEPQNRPGPRAAYVAVDLLKQKIASAKGFPDPSLIHIFDEYADDLLRESRQDGHSTELPDEEFSEDESEHYACEDSPEDGKKFVSVFRCDPTQSRSLAEVDCSYSWVLATATFDQNIPWHVLDEQGLARCKAYFWQQNCLDRDDYIALLSAGCADVAFFRALPGRCRNVCAAALQYPVDRRNDKPFVLNVLQALLNPSSSLHSNRGSTSRAPSFPETRSSLNGSSGKRSSVNPGKMSSSSDISSNTSSPINLPRGGDRRSVPNNINFENSFTSEKPILEHLSFELQNDPEVVLLAVCLNAADMQFASESLKNSKEFLLEALSHGASVEVVSHSGYADSADADFFLQAVVLNSQALAYCSKCLLKSLNTCEEERVSSFVFEALCRNGRALEGLPENLKANYKVVLRAVKSDGAALRYASEALRSNESIVLAAVKNCGRTLYHAGANCKANVGIVFAAVDHDGFALCYAAEPLLCNEKLIMGAVTKWGFGLGLAGDLLKDSPKIVLAAVKKYGDALKYASNRLKDDGRIVMAAVQQSGSALQFASPRLQQNPEFVELAVIQPPRSLPSDSRNL